MQSQKLAQALAQLAQTKLPDAMAAAKCECLIAGGNWIHVGI
jgi:hypothetical protein